MTLAPIEAATSGVRSVELLSTTMTSSTKSGMACSTFSIPCSSLRQGMMTVIDWPLYMMMGPISRSAVGRTPWSARDALVPLFPRPPAPGPWPPTPRRLFPRPPRHNDDHETVPLSPKLFRRAPWRRGTGRRALGVRFAHVPRDGPVSGEPAPGPQLPADFFRAHRVIMMIMKRFLFLLSCSGVLLGGAELAGVHSVYVLPMSRGMDQYLANRPLAPNSPPTFSAPTAS